MLYIVGTPIGNLQDITLRAIETLKNVEIILAEDTRRTKILLDNYNIDPRKLVSFHEHSSDQKIQDIVWQLKQGKEIALVTDAGMPGVADPGGKLVAAVVSKSAPSVISSVGEKSRQGIPNSKFQIPNKFQNPNDQKIMTPIPGVSALSTIMSISGVQNEPTLFLGYLPKKKGRRTLLTELNKESKKVKKGLFKTIVLFESPQRIERTLKDLQETFGADTNVVIGRELTKQFEEIRWTTLGEAINRSWSTKGEYTVLVATH